MDNWEDRFINKIVCGDNRVLLREIPDESIDCCITSPPYWSLRDYGTPPLIWDGDGGCEHEWGMEYLGDTRECNTGSSRWNHNPAPNGIPPKHISISQGAFCIHCGAWRGQLGLEPTFQLYLDHLMQIMAECKRVVKPTGTIWVNIGDSYAGSGKGAWDKTEVQKEVYVPPSGTPATKAAGIPAKSLVGIPERFAIRMTDELGLIRRNTIIWWKPNCMPSSVKDRFTVDFEPVYFFTKSGRYWFEQQKEEVRDWGTRDWSNFRGGTTDPKLKHHGLVNCNSAANGRNRRCVWNIPTQPYSESHFATFPEALVEPMILAGCPENGIVLDPFSGSNVTMLKALKLNRRAIGMELNSEYITHRQNEIRSELSQTRLAL